MKVMKFGGSSVGSAKKILQVANIIKDYSQKERLVIVVSAMSGITDKLISIFQKYQTGNMSEALPQIRNLYELHLNTLQKLELGKTSYQAGFEQINILFGQFISRLTLTQKFTLSDLDYIVSFGEKFSAHLLTLTLQKSGLNAKFIDSSLLIVTNNDFGAANPILPKTKERIEKLLFPKLMQGILPVVTGYFGKTKDGQVATLGRGGSDYSATILAYALDAQEVILWKEVDGIYTADPKKKEQVKFLSQLTYKQALKLAQNGAKILHPFALKPVAEKEIVVWVKNTFNPGFIGSKIWKGE